MRTTLAIGTILLAVATPAVSQVVINTSVWHPHTHALVREMTVPLCNDIAKTTNGRVKCNLLAQSVADPRQIFDAVAAGIADLSYVVDGYTPGRFVLSGIAEFPFLGDNGEITSVAYQRVYQSMLAQANEYAGVKVLAVFTTGPGQLFNTKRPINTLKDLEGLKIRTGGGLVNDIVKALGAVAMLKSAPETYELLSTGVIDGFCFPLEASAAFKLAPMVKYATIVPGGLYNAGLHFAMNPKKWDSIPAADRKLIEPLLGESLARRAGKAWDAADVKGEAALRDAKVPIAPASAELVAEIRARTSGLEKDWVAKAKRKGVDGAAALKAFRAETAKLARIAK